jgi:hypothetical protein
MLGVQPGPSNVKRLAELTDVKKLRDAYDFGNHDGGDALAPHLT